jgi:hypothetical protein
MVTLCGGGGVGPLKVPLLATPHTPVRPAGVSLAWHSHVTVRVAALTVHAIVCTFTPAVCVCVSPVLTVHVKLNH